MKFKHLLDTYCSDEFRLEAYRILKSSGDSRLAKYADSLLAGNSGALHHLMSAHDSLPSTSYNIGESLLASRGSWYLKGLVAFTTRDEEILGGLADENNKFISECIVHNTKPSIATR